MMRCKRTGEIEYNLTNRKKFSLVKHLLQLSKKLFNIFYPDFISIFQTSSRHRKVAGQISRLFKNYSKLCMNPVFLPLKSVSKSILLTAISQEDLNSSIIIEVYMHLSSNQNICRLQHMYKRCGFYLRLPHHFCSVVYFFFLSLYILCGKKINK